MENTIWISGREKQVLRMLLSEEKGHEIAKELNLSEKTIGTYKLRLLEKTGAKTIIGLYFWNKVNKVVEIEEQEFQKVTVRTSKSNLE
nr:helix-turn-helix transcriptional regulator [uncultured Flavobacterium sp.]